MGKLVRSLKCRLGLVDESLKLAGGHSNLIYALNETLIMPAYYIDQTHHTFRTSVSFNFHLCTDIHEYNLHSTYIKKTITTLGMMFPIVLNESSIFYNIHLFVSSYMLPRSTYSSFILCSYLTNDVFAIKHMHSIFLSLYNIQPYQTYLSLQNTKLTDDICRIRDEPDGCNEINSDLYDDFAERRRLNCDKMMLWEIAMIV